MELFWTEQQNNGRHAKLLEQGGFKKYDLAKLGKLIR